MNHGPFIAAAFGVAAVAVFGLVAYCYAAMRQAEGQAQRLKGMGRRR